MGEVLIDSRYVLLDHAAEFTLKKESLSSHRDWSISDGDGNLVFRTEGRYMESHRRTRLLDAATGNQIVCFEKKVLNNTHKCDTFCCSIVQLTSSTVVINTPVLQCHFFLRKMNCLSRCSTLHEDVCGCCVVQQSPSFVHSNHGYWILIMRVSDFLHC